MDRSLDQHPLESPRQRYLPWLLAGVGLAGLTAAFATSATDARSAAAQNWPPFVLVTALLLIVLVADDDGLFAAAGYQLARLSSSEMVLFAGATMIIAVVTAALNLDTSVAYTRQTHACECGA